MALRTRSRNTIVSPPGSAKQTIQRDAYNASRLFNRPASVEVRPAGTSVFTSFTGAFAVAMYGRTGLTETIIDKAENGRGSFNYVSHVSEKWSCPLVTLGGFKTKCNPPNQAGTSVETEFTVGAALGAAVSINAIPWMGSDAELRAECLSQMHPRKVKPGWDTSLQLGELNEALTAAAKFVSDLSDFADNLTALNKWNSPSVRKILGQRTIRQLSLQDWVDLAVSLDLTNTLAIQPMIDAMRQLDAARAAAESVMQRFLDQETTLHGQVVRTVTSTSAVIKNDYHKWGNTRKYELKVTCTARVKYHSERTKAFIYGFNEAYYGLHPSRSTAWELIPCSFIFDRFYNVGRFLANSLRKPMADVSYTVLSTGWSRKATCKSQGWVDLLEGTYGLSIKDAGDPGHMATGELWTSNYKRESIPLNLEEGTVPLPKLTMPDADFLFTLGELVYAMASGRSKFLEVAQRVPVSISRR